MIKNYFAIFLIFITNVYSQSDNDLIEKFLNNFPIEILYWEIQDTLSYDREPTTSFTSIKISYLKDSDVLYNFKTLETKLHSYDISGGYIESSRSYFYYIPCETQNKSNIQIQILSKRAVEYHSNNKIRCNTLQEKEDVLRKIHSFENDILACQKIQLKESKSWNQCTAYAILLPFTIYGAYAGFTDKGTLKMLSNIGGGLSAAGSITLIIEFTKGLVDIFESRSQIKILKERLNSLALK